MSSQQIRTMISTWRDVIGLVLLLIGGITFFLKLEFHMEENRFHFDSHKAAKSIHQTTEQKREYLVARSEYETNKEAVSDGYKIITETLKEMATDINKIKIEVASQSRPYIREN